MLEGEKELRKVFEETSTNNIKAMLEHGNESRKLVRELQERLDHVETQLRQKEEKIESLRTSIVQLQMKTYNLEARV